MSFKSRTTWYSLALAFGVFQNIMSIFSALFGGFAPYMTVFGGIAAGWALLTWVWTSVLLAYNNRPLSSHALTRASAHLASFIILAIGWLGNTILLGTQFPLQCDFKRDSDGEASVWCSFGATSFSLAVLLCIFCTAAASVIYRSARNIGGLGANVAHGDKLGSTPLI